MTEEFTAKELANRWISVLRSKASQYEHEAREKGKVVTAPDLDDVCNEMTAYFTGIIK